MKSPHEIMPVHHIEHFSSELSCLCGTIPVLKRCNYYVVNSISVNGDAPKSLLRVYDYSKDNKYFKSSIEKWPLYIAKTGHKWYPNESITEYLLNRLGEVFSLEMAESRLMIVNNQVRFMSKYFLEPSKQVLIHGAEIFAGYLSNDNAFVEQVEEQNLARDLFTLQFVEKAVRYSFPTDYESLMHELVKLLLFDALVGNNDRHYFNWAVIKSISGEKRPVFSPIYDTARGLFWNESDTSLSKWTNPAEMERHLKKYCNNSRPKLGWEGYHNINHFELCKQIFNTEFYISKKQVELLFTQEMFEQMKRVVVEEFSSLFSPLRLLFIINCLEFRYNTIKDILQ